MTSPAPLTEAEKAVRSKLCAIDDCDRPSRARGWCNMHYLRWQNRGSAKASIAPSSTFRPYKNRFYEKVQLPNADGCMEWTGNLCKNGYGRFRLEGRLVSAHRLSYELMVGPIPDGLEIDHVKARGCKSRACCNPDHLEPVTGLENTLRSDSISNINRAKTECLRGHPFDEENTYVNPKGQRSCRQCRRDLAASRQSLSLPASKETP